MTSSWLSGSQAHSATLVAIVVAALLREALLLAASPAFDRSLARFSRSPCARLVRGLSPGEHNFDPLGGDTHRWTTWNPPKYAAQRARDLLLATITHTRLRYEVVSRRRRRWRTGRGREGRTCIAYTQYVSPLRGPTTRNDSRPSRGDRERGLHGAVTPNSQIRPCPATSEGGGWLALRDDEARQDRPRTHSRDRQSCRRRRSAIVQRIGAASYRLSRARAIDRLPISSVLRGTFTRRGRT